MNTPDNILGPPPEWEHDEAYRAAWLEASRGDELYDDGLEYRISDLVDTATWDEETKHEFCVDLDDDMTNGQMQEVIEYLLQYQPRTPFSEVKNPTQKQISTFIRKVCNL